ncbi:MAG TPA: ISAs1 family transposase, partial [Steroidobacteraceae bacterium]|nr:ISAs1 family transposase [Steroidobacteraceae bacterium]
MEGRRLRRMAGFLAARLPELDLDAVEDPRAREGKWSLAQVLRATLLGLMAGCRSLRETERLTASLSVASRRQLGLQRRLPDTTARDLLCAVSLDEVRATLHRAVKEARRRKALEPDGLPMGVVALDGKVTALPCLNQRFIQTQHPEVGLPYGLARTMTAALVSAQGRPCIDAIPIPASTNEAGHFQAAFSSLVETHGSLFDLVSYDAGGFSRANADAVIATGKEYLFALKDEQRAMCRLADEMLAGEVIADRTEDPLDNATTVVRSLRMVRADPSWAYGDGKGPHESIWRHAKAFLRVDYVKVQHGEIVQRDDRMYVCSLDPERLSTAEWLRLVRAHWGVENNNHHTFDTAFAEDDRPWIEADANGMLAVLVLRRIAYTLLALFRSSLRTEENRATPWRDLMHWVSVT